MQHRHVVSISRGPVRLTSPVGLGAMGLTGWTGWTTPLFYIAYVKEPLWLFVVKT